MHLCFALALQCAAPVGVALPAEVQVPPGRVVVLKAETAGEVVRWATLADGVDLLAFPDGKSAVFCSPVAGRFTVLAWTAAGNVPSEAARVVVVVGTPKPAANDFAAELRSLLTTADAGHVKTLAAAYRAAAELAGKPDIATAGELAERVRAAVRGALPADALGAIRKRIAIESAARLPAGPDAPLTAEIRASAAKLFAEIATTLEGK